MESFNDPNIIREMDKKCQTLFKEIWEENDFNTNAAIKAMFFMIFNIKSTTESTNTQVAKISIIEQATYENKESIKNLQLRINELECEQCKNQIILRKVPLHPSVSTGGTETNNQTTEQITNLFKDLKIEYQPKDFPEAFRVPIKGNQNKRKTIPNIFLKFPTFSALSQFYKNISNLQESDDFNEIRVDKFVPQSMLEDYNNAQAKAYTLRNQKPKKKTFIKLSKGKVILLYKTPSGSTWKESTYESEITETKARNAPKKRKNSLTLH